MNRIVESPPGPARLKDLRVLLIEDHPAQRQLVRKLLSLLGIEAVQEAGCGRDGIALLHGSNFQFDLVITDLRMPDGDGLEVIRSITQDAMVQQVVLLTAVEDDIVVALHSLPAEVNGSRLMTVAKPINLKRLEEICQLTLQRRDQHRQAHRRWSQAELQTALDSGELLAFLEPQIDLRRGTVLGFEALARWRHPDLGLLSPADFVDDYQRAGLMQALTLRMLASALDALSLLRAEGYEGGLSVNFGASCLEDPQFAAEAAALVRRTGESCKSITLELTETSSIEDSVVEISNLARLRMEGFHLAIDDFGMGHSSLVKLQRGAFDEIKIDREFSSRVAADRSSRAAVESILTLARFLGVSCVAEGIEDEQSRQLLAESGCQIGQGYLFSRPLDPQQLGAWWRQWNATLQQRTDSTEDSEADMVAGEAPATLDDRTLARLARRDQPAWIFDIDHLRMVWANQSGLDFWRADSLAELLCRDFKGDMSISTRQRLLAYRDKLRNGQPLAERWTVYPNDQPQTVDCLITGIYTHDGRASMLIEATPVGSLGASEHYPAESARAAAVAILVAKPSGDIVWQNPLSAYQFGAGLSHCDALLGSPERARELLDQALAGGQAIADSLDRDGQRPPLKKVVVRRNRDAASGELMLVLTVL